MNKLIKISVITSLFFSQLISAQTIDLSKNEWILWIDNDAEYFNDELFMPPYNLSEISSNEPTCGWEVVNNQSDIYHVTLPATVEQYAWGKNGNYHGIGGDYTGVSWFSTVFDMPAVGDKRVVLNFESARMRAEVYLNEELVGYEMINGLPFTVDISNKVKQGQKNNLSVRITDPNGNFAWRDWDAFKWGNYETMPSHGFGGITGAVELEITDKTYIEDVFIQNTPKLNKIITKVNLAKLGAPDPASNGGVLLYKIKEFGNDKVLWETKQVLKSLTNDDIIEKSITLNNAKLWTPDSPNLYVLELEWNGNDGSKHIINERFGFRWFEVKVISGDKMFFLNDKRVILHTAISWGHWPVNGIYPTPELAKKHIMAAKELGMNMLNFHRGISQSSILDLADELGLMIYEEPGGYKPGFSDFIETWKREKLLRMVNRDKNHPSVVIYNMINESTRVPFANEVKDLRDAHMIDPTRCITFTSTMFPKRLNNGITPTSPDSIKTHMLPNDTTVYIQGWWDRHHAGGPGVYMDEHYNSPTNFLRYKSESDEIIFYGEEGAIGTPHRLQLIKEEIDRTGHLGWNGQAMLDQYNAFDKFLKDNDFTDSFEDVDALCLKFGEVSYYYQAKMIENMYISNNIDGWATNGWEGTKVENHSGVVDLYRNHKADPSIIAYYNQPHYVAVKARNKVLKLGESSIVDFFMVNKINLKGSHTLTVSLVDNKGNETQSQSFRVNLKGGVTYGQLLKDNIKFTLDKEGYNTVKAELYKGKKLVSKGFDKLFIAKQIDVESKFYVADTSGGIQKTLHKSNIINFEETTIHRIVTDNSSSKATLVVGADIQPGCVIGNFRQDDPLIDWLIRGGTLIITRNADEWCKYLEYKEIVDYRGCRILDKNWFGGNFFVKKHPLFDGLPQATAFNWEYQAFSAYNKSRIGLRLENGNCVVGCYADHKNEMFSALSVISVGKGKVVISTLDFEKGAGNAVANRLLQNIVQKFN